MQKESIICFSILSRHVARQEHSNPWHKEAGRESQLQSSVSLKALHSTEMHHVSASQVYSFQRRVITTAVHVIKSSLNSKNYFKNNPVISVSFN